MQDRSSGGHNLEYDKTTTHILNIWKQYDSILCINEILIEPEHNVEIAPRDWKYICYFIGLIFIQYVV